MNESISTILGSFRKKAMTGNSRQYIQRKERSRISSSSELFVTNQVHGVWGGYVPVIITAHPSMIRTIQKQYALGNLYCFVREEKFMLVGLKIVNWKRLKKILKASNSENYTMFLKYSHAKVYLDAEYVGMLYSPSQGAYSRPHANILHRRGLPVMEQPLVGIPSFKKAIKITRGHC